MNLLNPKEMQKYCSELEKYKVTCKCGHKVVVLPTQKMKYRICSWCGRKVYLNKKSEFMDKLETSLKRGGKHGIL